MRKTILERFEAKYEPVTESGCWLWTGAIWMKDRYGAFWIDASYGSMQGAHRASVILYKGQKLTPEDHVCHKCDVTLCVNPDHLFVSDHSGNMRDMVTKGRKITAKQKLNAAMIQEVIRLRGMGLKQREVAEIMGVDRSQISRAERGHRTYFNPEPIKD